jgi:hypothetical protein
MKTKVLFDIDLLRIKSIKEFNSYLKNDCPMNTAYLFGTYETEQGTVTRCIDCLFLVDFPSFNDIYDRCCLWFYENEGCKSEHLLCVEVVLSLSDCVKGVVFNKDQIEFRVKKNKKK